VVFNVSELAACIVYVRVVTCVVVCGVILMCAVLYT